jgi:hypothetical protein
VFAVEFDEEGEKVKLKPGEHVDVIVDEGASIRIAS